MRNAKFFLVVRFTLEPQAEPELLRMIYGIESRAAFEAYEANAALKARFARERAPFEKQMRIERFFGEAEKSYAA
jgi:hypothetical protein